MLLVHSSFIYQFFYCFLLILFRLVHVYMSCFCFDMSFNYHFWNGIHIQVTDNNFTCSCKNGYTGSKCETNVGHQLCEMSPCMNNGTCISLTNSYTCECMPFFEVCDYRVNPVDECIVWLYTNINCRGKTVKTSLIHVDLALVTMEPLV